MPENYYEDAPDASAPAETETPAGGAEGEEYSEGQTAVLPKAFLQGKDFKPGDEMVVLIKAIHGDRVEVAYAPEKGAEEEGEPPHPGESETEAHGEGGGGGGGGMASMMGY